MMEMNPLKCEFFDCDQYVTTVDDLIATLLEVLQGASVAVEEWFSLYLMFILKL